MSEAGSDAPPATYETGQVCWVELGTKDVQNAKRFYGGVVGWEFEDRPMPHGEGIYTMIFMDGQDVGGVYDITKVPAIPHEVPPHWMPYVKVDDADATAAAARAAGGVVLHAPIDVQGVGRIAVIADRQGASISLYQPGDRAGATRRGDQPGGFCWFELATPDTSSAKDFYTQLLPWTPQDVEVDGQPYVMLMLRTHPAGGMLQMTDDWVGVPPHWASYVNVPDCDAAVAKARELGGQVVHGPFDAAGVGRIAIIRDPQGASVSLITLVPNPDATQG